MTSPPPAPGPPPVPPPPYGHPPTQPYAAQQHPPPGQYPPGHYPPAPYPQYPYPPGQPPPGYRIGPPPPLSPGGQRLAEFVDRLLAYIIDYAILFGVTMVVVMPVYLYFFVQTFNELPVAVTVDQEQVVQPPFSEVFGALLPLFGVMLLAFLFAFFLYYLYEVEMMHRSGQTLGKKLIKIRVVPLDPTQRLTRGMAAKRFLIKWIVGSMVPFFTYLDGLWQLWDKPYRQCLHDKWPGTVVIKLDS